MPGPRGKNRIIQSMKPLRFLALCSVAGLLAGCSGKAPEPAAVAKAPTPVFFKVDPATAGSITGTVHFKGKKAAPKAIDMSEEPACVTAHHGKAFDESLVV